MFADNWKISLRQIRRLMILDLFGLSSLMLPGLFSDMTGADGIFCLLLGGLGALALLGLMQGNLKDMKGSYYEYMRQASGQLLADIFMVFYLLYFVSLAGYVLYQTAALVLAWLLPEGSYLWVCILLLAFAAYGTIRGIEGRARVYEILFWFLGIPLLVMLALGAREVNADYWTPIVYSSGKALAQESTAVLLFFLPLTGLLFLKPFCRKPEKIASCGKMALFAVTAVNVLIYLMVIGTFGHHTVQVLKRPVITLMSMVRMPGGFLSRQDVVMTAVWFFALFALLNTGVFQGTLILKELCREKKTSYSMWVVLILALMTGVGFFENNEMEQIFGAYQQKIALPGVVGILLFSMVMFQIQKRWRRKGKNREGSGRTGTRKKELESGQKELGNIEEELGKKKKKTESKEEKQESRQEELGSKEEETESGR